MFTIHPLEGDIRIPASPVAARKLVGTLTGGPEPVLQIRESDGESTDTAAKEGETVLFSVLFSEETEAVYLFRDNRSGGRSAAIRIDSRHQPVQTLTALPPRSRIDLEIGERTAAFELKWDSGRFRNPRQARCALCLGLLNPGEPVFVKGDMEFHREPCMEIYLNAGPF